ncbi:hypothetical protein HD553DRAFT_340713 [Filobasidium floriforme]|uniref:uncharacterized protein n=1 Tax=Filobasidium floriforme TaxID=5210 RepID=UPI001E8DC2E0|nr:uncharacterized protein HD553DRAFT_340713 [Filobasidium floriforme]KAH8087538.1 hypothetical protein HD553DRAFT_340713 [Filobasidium floriforme]
MGIWATTMQMASMTFSPNRSKLNDDNNKDPSQKSPSNTRDKKQLSSAANELQPHPPPALHPNATTVNVIARSGPIVTRSVSAAKMSAANPGDLIDLSTPVRKPYSAVAAGSQANLGSREGTSGTVLKKVAEAAIQKEKEAVRDLQGQVSKLQQRVKAANDKIERLQTDVNRNEKEKDEMKQAGRAAVTKFNEASRERTDLRKQLAVQINHADDLSKHVDRIQAQHKQTKNDLEAALAATESEVNRLRQERSAQASLAPASSKTEEEYFRDISSLNQKVKDLANHMTRDPATSGLFEGTRKEQRVDLQSFIHRVLWCDVFDRLLGFLSTEEQDFMGTIARLLEPTQRTLWVSMTFSSVSNRYTMSDMVHWTTQRIVRILGDNTRIFSPSAAEMFEEIIAMAVEIQFSLGKEGKNVQIIYAAENAPFDPAAMQDANNRSPDTEDNPIIDIPSASDPASVPPNIPTGPPRVVFQCLGFGFQGSAGIEQKCSVTLAPVAV